MNPARPKIKSLNPQAIWHTSHGPMTLAQAQSRAYEHSKALELFNDEGILVARVLPDGQVLV